MPSHHFLLYILGYTGLFAITGLSHKHNGNRLVDEQGITSDKPMLLGSHLVAIAWIGIFCICFFQPGLPEIAWGKKTPTGLQVSVIILLTAIGRILAIVEAEKKFSAIAGRMPGEPVATGFMSNYIVARVLFLCLYELWFRGYLLINSIIAFGITFAIILNIALYSLLHKVNGRREMLACIPIGAILCGVCAWTGAAWPAILIHVVMTLSHEIHLVKKIHKSLISFI
jgi:membrane protease YdiL (CAAX protease family)